MGQNHPEMGDLGIKMGFHGIQRAKTRQWILWDSGNKNDGFMALHAENSLQKIDPIDFTRASQACLEEWADGINSGRFMPKKSD